MSDDLEGLDECANCEGLFFPEDMTGEHCRECYAEIFGEEG